MYRNNPNMRNFREIIIFIINAEQYEALIPLMYFFSMLIGAWTVGNSIKSCLLQLREQCLLQ
jgi:hypothetical protein